MEEQCEGGYRREIRRGGHRAGMGMGAGGCTGPGGLLRLAAEAPGSALPQPSAPSPCSQFSDRASGMGGSAPPALCLSFPRTRPLVYKGDPHHFQGLASPKSLHRLRTSSWQCPGPWPVGAQGRDVWPSGPQPRGRCVEGGKQPAGKAGNACPCHRPCASRAHC